MTQYTIYLLRIWHKGAPDQRQWSARLECLPGGDSIQFTDQAALLEYLQAVTSMEQHETPRS